MNETICALATAPGGALGIIRVSGTEAFAAVSSICSVHCDCCAANTIHLARILDGSELIDEVLVSVFRAPHSYTGEDAVEISCHGSIYILNRVLEMLLEHGCRMAKPGEYTMRAYLNGKMDLSQAEAVADLVASSNKASHLAAISQLKGQFSNELVLLRNELLKLTSLLELELDFSDHEDLEFADRSELLELAEITDARIRELAGTFKQGQAIKHGIPVAIVGKTNVGKSTLLNKLVGDDRAIISSIHGTTRDTIEDEIEIDGVKFRFIDTAGIRETTDEIERIGIERTMRAIEKARIVIWLFDTLPARSEILKMAELTKGKRELDVLNKCDLYDMEHFVPNMVPMTCISAKHGTGINTLKRKIFEEAKNDGLIGQESDIIITNARHYDSLIRAHESTQQVIDSLEQNLSTDLIAENLRQAINVLAEITGSQITPQETLDNIFSNFCVGK